jgi:hypothetical protein
MKLINAVSIWHPYFNIIAYRNCQKLHFILSYLRLQFTTLIYPNLVAAISHCWVQTHPNPISLPSQNQHLLPLYATLLPTFLTTLTYLLFIVFQRRPWYSNVTSSKWCSIWRGIDHLRFRCRGTGETQYGGRNSSMEARCGSTSDGPDDSVDCKWMAY